jgi:transcriptional regulator with XRE-family HTH domain
MTFSEELKRKRQRAKMSLREAARATKGAVSFVMLFRYERGAGLDGMSLHHARAIAKLYGWEISDMTRQIARQVKGAKKVKEREHVQNTG